MAIPTPSHYNNRSSVSPKPTKSPPPSALLHKRDDIRQSRSTSKYPVEPTVTATSSATTDSRPHHRPRSIRPAGDLEADNRRHGGLDASVGSESSGMTARSSEDFEMDGIDDLDDDRLEDDEETGLTGKDKRRRRERKATKTRLDERVAGGSGGGRWNNDPGEEDQRELIKSAAFWRNIAYNGTLIGLWYIFSISISVYNKWMFSEKGHSADGDEETTKSLAHRLRDDPRIFPFPLFTTCLHMVVQFILAGTVLWIFPRFRPRHDSINAHTRTEGDEPEDMYDPKKPVMTKWFYLTRVGPCGAATSFDIGLGNMSMRFISLTFYTMCKSSVLGFVLLFAFIFRLEKPSWQLIMIILAMTIGVIMMVAGETEFNPLGFTLVMSAAASSGFRWSLTQILLLRHPATSNPFSSIFALAPIMFITIFALAVPVEGLFALGGGLAHLMSLKGTVFGVLALLFPGCLAFCMTASEFALLQRTSVVTLSIAGIFKEVVTISAASIVFDDQLTPINISGLVLTIATIAAYNYIKYRKMQAEADSEGIDRALGGPDISSDEDESNGPNGGIPFESESLLPSSSKSSKGRTGDLRGNSLMGPPPLNLVDDQVGDSPARKGPPKRPEDLE
ncbi:TPT-domain-containing protein [Eremomyces bilateralis CBS 781.70]|uniref:TPT-domain-containing protein n=1 Tax=Eremomyces bilateralis CBS 781.70 TaxID=1392243 RepID=A0A6G1FTI5_9PEZI|nr:TPT-domain-containing protein [Eremomyces bilateralis CBS 781.70]KAF1809050.1 TPT-domain-containing protein [Eremomyces bilateralis CBS 781.70]